MIFCIARTYQDIRRFLMIYILLLLLSSTLVCDDRLKLYALYTPSHAILKDNYFLPSIKDDFEIILQEAEQTCPSTHFMSQGWTQTTIKKVDLIIKAIHDNWGSIFIFSDVDIQFFRPITPTILTLIKDYDLIIQKNNPDGVLCSGFFVCRANQKTLNLWMDVKKTMEKNNTLSDQISLNRCIKRHHKKNAYNIRWQYLPNTFFGAGTCTGKQWKRGDKLPIPNGIFMHHANWTKGIKNKIAQLEYVKKVVHKYNL